MPNAIDAADFAYDEKTRKEMREKYGLQDKFVVGHVGRFGFMKNHDFLLDVFAEIEKELPESRLLLIGFSLIFSHFPENNRKNPSATPVSLTNRSK